MNLTSRAFGAACGLWIGLAFLAAPAFGQGAPAETDYEKAFYAIGASLSAQLADLNPISDREFDLIFQGIRDGVAGRTGTADPNANRLRVRNLIQARKEPALLLEKEASAGFLSTETRKAGTTTTESGLIYSDMKIGTGPSPSATDRVRVHYHGTLRDGTVFDSSIDRGQASEFPLNKVIQCWTEGVAMMKVGGKAKLICPPEIAYGNQRNGRIPPGSVLVFEVQLLEIVK